MIIDDFYDIFLVSLLAVTLWEGYNAVATNLR